MPTTRSPKSRSTTSRSASTATLSLLDPAVAAWEVSAADLTDVLADLSAEELALVVPVLEGDDGPDGLEVLDGLGFDTAELVATHEPGAAPGTVTTIPLAPGTRAARRVHVVGAGAGTADDLREAGAAAGRATRDAAQAVLVAAHAMSEVGLAALVEGAVLGGWTPPRWSRDGLTCPARPADRVTVVSSAEDAADVVARAVARARATLLARSLGVTPSNIKNPAWMVAQARTLARRTGLALTVWTEKELAAEGFGGLLAVGGGSATPPRLARLDYEPGGADSRTPHVVLVGKGITFDSGGLSIKPRDGMLAMKTDMMGSAAVLAALATCRELGIRVRVTGLLALAENAVSGASYRPGDVVRQYGGTTTEIGNTDAEGRIVLADALAHAATDLRPDVIVDIATLTGAARVALARVMAPVYATDDALRDALVEASETVGETLWPMPLPTAYRAALDSDVADLKQFTAANGGGSIMAAWFLREFVGTTPWAHLDIAGPGRSDVDAGALSKGPTGFGTRVLLRWLEGLR